MEISEIKNALNELAKMFPTSKDNRISIIVGKQLIAFKDPKSDWKIKKVMCDQCGECCMDLPPTHLPFGVDLEGKCNALKKQNDKWICTAGHKTPVACLSDPIDIEELGCCIEYF